MEIFTKLVIITHKLGFGKKPKSNKARKKKKMLYEEEKHVVSMAPENNQLVNTQQFYSLSDSIILNILSIMASPLDIAHFAQLSQTSNKYVKRLKTQKEFRGRYEYRFIWHFLSNHTYYPQWSTDTDWWREFHKSEKEQYRFLTHQEKRLFSLVKEGDKPRLEEHLIEWAKQLLEDSTKERIQKDSLTRKQLIEQLIVKNNIFHREEIIGYNTTYTVLNWAQTLNHVTVQKYFYELIKEYYESNIPLEWAIKCCQPFTEIKSLPGFVKVDIFYPAILEWFLIENYIEVLPDFIQDLQNWKFDFLSWRTHDGYPLLHKIIELYHSFLQSYPIKSADFNEDDPESTSVDENDKKKIGKEQAIIDLARIGLRKAKTAYRVIQKLVGIEPQLLNQKAPTGHTPLSSCNPMLDHGNLINYFLDQPGINLKEKTCGKTLLHILFTKQHFFYRNQGNGSKEEAEFPLIKRLAQMEPTLLTEKDSDGFTSLDNAILYGQERIVLHFLDHPKVSEVLNSLLYSAIVVHSNRGPQCISFSFLNTLLSITPQFLDFKSIKHRPDPLLIVIENIKEALKHKQKPESAGENEESKTNENLTVYVRLLNYLLQRSNIDLNFINLDFFQVIADIDNQEERKTILKSVQKGFYSRLNNPENNSVAADCLNHLDFTAIKQLKGTEEKASWTVEEIKIIGSMNLIKEIEKDIQAGIKFLYKKECAVAPLYEEGEIIAWKISFSHRDDAIFVRNALNHYFYHAPENPAQAIQFLQLEEKEERFILSIPIHDSERVLSKAKEDFIEAHQKLKTFLEEVNPETKRFVLKFLNDIFRENIEEQINNRTLSLEQIIINIEEFQRRVDSLSFPLPEKLKIALFSLAASAILYGLLSVGIFTGAPLVIGATFLAGISGACVAYHTPHFFKHRNDKEKIKSALVERQPVPQMAIP
jgi:hypothetical protein